MNKNFNKGSLSDIKVIDLTRVLSGPFCTMLLADMGAEVIKIEPPKGDNVRNQGDMIDGYSSYFCLLYTSPSPRDRSLSRMPSSA